MTEEDEIDEEARQRSGFEILYYKTVADARTVIERAQQIRTSSLTQSPSIREQNEGTIRNNGVNLPKLKFPKFNGNYSYWFKFRDSFT